MIIKGMLVYQYARYKGHVLLLYPIFLSPHKLQNPLIPQELKLLPDLILHMPIIGMQLLQHLLELIHLL